MPVWLVIITQEVIGDTGTLCCIITDWMHSTAAPPSSGKFNVSLRPENISFSQTISRVGHRLAGRPPTSIKVASIHPEKSPTNSLWITRRHSDTAYSVFVRESDSSVTLRGDTLTHCLPPLSSQDNLSCAKDKKKVKKKKVGVLEAERQIDSVHCLTKLNASWLHHKLRVSDTQFMMQPFITWHGCSKCLHFRIFKFFLKNV